MNGRLMLLLFQIGVMSQQREAFSFLIISEDICKGNQIFIHSSITNIGLLIGEKPTPTPYESKSTGYYICYKYV